MFFEILADGLNLTDTIFNSIVKFLENLFGLPFNYIILIFISLEVLYLCLKLKK